MPSMKKVIMSEACVLCGLCEQPELSHVFERTKNGKIRVLLSGVWDIDSHQEIAEVVGQCPVGALKLDEDSVVSGADLAYEKLLDYPFEPPKYSDYSYEQGIYQASQTPAQYRSAQKYRSYESAEDAGVAEFERTVWKQATAVLKQYIIAYKVKKLKKYFSYEENEGNYYFQRNQEIASLLSETQHYASLITHGKASLPEDLSRFNVQPKLEDDLSSYDNLESFQFVFEQRKGFHNPDYYRTYIDIDSDNNCEKYFYDFTRAEAMFREDMDYFLEWNLEDIVRHRVEYVTKRYLERAKQVLLEKLDILQQELKKHMKTDGEATFKQAVESVYQQIIDTPTPKIKAPRAYSEIDTDYSSDFRFTRKNDCEKAADNRRERAYKESRHFVERLPRNLNDAYMEQLKSVLTEWKRLVLRAYDISGKDYPAEGLTIAIGRDNIVDISLNKFDDATLPYNREIESFIEKDILQYGTSAGTAKLAGEYECEITVYHQCEYKDTVFGNLKEYNHRYSYGLYSLHKFLASADEVAEACVTELEKASFQRDFFQEIKESFISGLRTLTGVFAGSVIIETKTHTGKTEGDPFADIFNLFNRK